MYGSTSYPPSPAQEPNHLSVARRAKHNFFLLVQANIVGKPPYLISLTYQEHLTDLKVGWKHFNAFIRQLRYRFGNEFRYLAVPEWQGNGRLHFHTLFWGLPEDLQYRPGLPEEVQNRIIARTWNRGFVDVVLTDGSPKLATYLSAYFSYSFVDEKMHGQQHYTASKNVFKPVIQKGLTPLMLNYWKEENGIKGVTPKFRREFDTKWYGTCVDEWWDL
jgi:hypothetical protein